MSGNNCPDLGEIKHSVDKTEYGYTWRIFNPRDPRGGHLFLLSSSSQRKWHYDTKENAEDMIPECINDLVSKLLILKSKIEEQRRRKADSG